MYSLQIQQQPQTWRECSGIQFNTSGRTVSKARSNWTRSVSCCFHSEDGSRLCFLPKHMVWEENKGWTIQEPGSSFHHSCACEQGLLPGHTLCSAEAAAVLSPGCSLKHLCKRQQGPKNRQWDKGMCSRGELGELLKYKQDWLAPAAPLACPRAASSYSSTAKLLPFPASSTTAHPSHFLLNYHYSRPESSVALFDGPNSLPILFLQWKISLTFST